MGLLGCLDPAIQTFPNFSESVRVNTVHLDIANTQMISLPTFKDWPLLQIADLRNNSQLNVCHQLEWLFPQNDITLYTDCETTPPVTAVPCTTGQLDQNPFLFSVLCVVAVLVEMVAIAVWLIKRKISKVNNYRLKPRGVASETYFFCLNYLNDKIYIFYLFN